MRIKNLHRKDLHHAYLIRGRPCCFNEVKNDIEAVFGICLKGNPNVFSKEFSKISADDAREIVKFSDISVLGVDTVKIILVYFDMITVEAQNILLKTLEEPGDRTYIFAVTPNMDTLLPTVLSRCVSVEFQTYKQGNKHHEDVASEFVNASIKDRIKIIDKINREKDGAKKKARFLEILDDVETHLRCNNLKESAEMRTLKIKSVLNAKRYMHSKGAMSKMLMESVALVI